MSAMRLAASDMALLLLGALPTAYGAAFTLEQVLDRAGRLAHRLGVELAVARAPGARGR
jgi:hypothetical protein